MSPEPNAELARSVVAALAAYPPRRPLAPPISGGDPDASARNRDMLDIVNLLAAEVYQDRPPRAAVRMIHRPGVRALARLARRVWQFRGPGRYQGILGLGVGPSGAGGRAIKVLVRSEREEWLLRDCRSVTTPAGFTHRVEVAVGVPRGQCAGVPVQGGCSIGHTRAPDTPIFGTVACRVARTDGYHYLLTAGHVVAGGNAPPAGTRLSHPCPALNGAQPTDIADVFAIRLADRKPFDVALLGPVTPAVAAPGIPALACVPTTFREPDENEAVRMYGAVSGRVISGTVSSAFATTYVDFPGVGGFVLMNLVTVQTNTPTSPGDSGAAWVADRDGALLGIHTGANVQGEALFSKFVNVARDRVLAVKPG